MRLREGDIFDQGAKRIVIPINRQVSKSGKAIMGKGLAKALKDLHPEAADKLGALLQEDSTKPWYFIGYLNGVDYFGVVTKDHYQNDSNLDDVRENLSQFRDGMLLGKGWCGDVYLPLLGAGEGGLDSKDVIKMMDNELPENSFILCMLPEEGVEETE